MRALLRDLLCRVGWHRWEPEPHHRDLIRTTGIDIIFTTSGIQTGRRRCQCCGTEQDIYREGQCGLGGYAGRWRYCSPEQKARIERLPVL